jgi:hypothetical protein
MSSAFSEPNIAALSRPDSGWKDRQQGKHGGTVQEPHKRVNYFHHLIFPHINEAAVATGWKSSAMAVRLKAKWPKIFANLHRATVFKWFGADKKSWSDETLKKIQIGQSLASKGRKGVLHSHPDIIKDSETQLRSLRNAGVPVTTVVARAVLLTNIKSKAPKLLENGFLCSEVILSYSLLPIVG